MDIMLKPPSEEDQLRWQTLVREELSSNNSRRGAYSEVSTLIDIGSMDYTELKGIALENILRLEQAGKISRHRDDEHPCRQAPKEKIERYKGVVTPLVLEKDDSIHDFSLVALKRGQSTDHHRGSKMEDRK